MTNSIGRGLSDPMLRRVPRARDRLHDEYAEPLTIETLAATAGLSRWHFQRCFREALGATPHGDLSRTGRRSAAPARRWP